jgi:hypothetical protein
MFAVVQARRDGPTVLRQHGIVFDRSQDLRATMHTTHVAAGATGGHVDRNAGFGRRPWISTVAGSMPSMGRDGCSRQRQCLFACLQVSAYLNCADAVLIMQRLSGRQRTEPSSWTPRQLHQHSRSRMRLRQLRSCHRRPQMACDCAPALGPWRLGQLSMPLHIRKQLIAFQTLTLGPDDSHLTERGRANFDAEPKLHAFIVSCVFPCVSYSCTAVLTAG